MSKENIRMQVWRLMEEHDIAAFPRPVYHRVPNFIGAEAAAANLRRLREYKSAHAVVCNPDSPQHPVREMVLRDGKQLVMATPKLKQGFLSVEPNRFAGVDIAEASSIRGAFKHGRQIDPATVKVDLFVAGAVAVSLTGARLGKGTGYSDQEYAILKKAGALQPRTLVVTTVHDVQIVNAIPSNEWDIPVDVIVTPTRVIRIKK